MQSGSPNDVPFGRYVRDSGLAAPLVLLTFGSIWLFPLIASLVAGDIVAAEDGNGTLKTILTRRSTRGQMFAAKVGAAVTYALLALPPWRSSRSRRPRSSGASTRSRASRARRSRPGAGCCWWLASLGVYALPLLAITTIGVLLSTVTRNSAGAVVGALMIGAADAADRHPARRRGHQALPADDAVRRLARASCARRSTGSRSRAAAGSPRSTRAVALTGAYLVFLRRDVAGG